MQGNLKELHGFCEPDACSNYVEFKGTCEKGQEIISEILRTGCCPHMD